MQRIGSFWRLLSPRVSNYMSWTMMCSVNVKLWTQLDALLAPGSLVLGHHNDASVVHC